MEREISKEEEEFIVKYGMGEIVFAPEPPPNIPESLLKYRKMMRKIFGGE